MAVDVVGTNHELAVKVWEEGLEAEVLKKIYVMGFMGKRSDSLIQVKDQLTKGPGDEITIGLRMQHTKAPVTSGTKVEDQESVLDLYYAKIRIDEFADAFRWRNIIDRQRVTFEHRDEAKAALADQLANAFDTSFFNQLAGVAGSGGAVTFEGHNPILAPDDDHIITVGTSADTVAGEATVAAGDILSLDAISAARQKAKLLTPAIRPARIPGFSEPMYVCFMHPWQAYNIKASDSRWDKVHMALLQAGGTSNNPLLTGAMGVWDNTLLVESSRVPSPGTGAGGVLLRRAIFCGAQAGLAAWGRLGGTPNKFRWVEKLFDFDREMGILGGFVAGIRKARFLQDNAGAGSFDFGTIVITSASPNG